MSYDARARDYVRQKMPMLGLGTWEVTDEKMIFDVIDAALGAGYRYIDTAEEYKNEAMIGRALKELLPKHNLKREDIFITTKLAPSNQGSATAIKAIKKSLSDLQTDYVDLLLIHWPGAEKPPESKENSKLRHESWQEMEQFYEKGDLKSIGVSNYEIRHLEVLLNHAKVLPAVNQCEYHPQFQQRELVQYCKNKGIHFQAYSSLGSGSGHEDLFKDQKVNSLAEKYNVSVTILLLAWAINQGISVLPRSGNPQHVVQNFKALALKISQDDINSLISDSACDKRCEMPYLID